MTPFDPIRLQNIIPESMEIWVNGQWDRDGIILPTVKPWVSYRLELPFLLMPRTDLDFLQAFPPANSAFSVLLARCFVLSFFLASLVS